MAKLWPKEKHGFKKKRTRSPLKPNIFSIQIFPPLRTTTKPNNHSKQGFYTKRGIPNPQTSIHTKFHTQIHIKLSYISIPDFFFSLNFSSSLLLLFFFLSSSSLLLFFSSSSSSLLLFSLSLFSPSLFLYVKALPKWDILVLKIRPCLALSNF